MYSILLKSKLDIVALIGRRVGASPLPLPPSLLRGTAERGEAETVQARRAKAVGRVVRSCIFG
jgi:hypothetical protein